METKKIDNNKLAVKLRDGSWFVAYKTNGKYYFTSMQNYDAYISNAGEIHELHDVESLLEVAEFLYYNF